MIKFDYNDEEITLVKPAFLVGNGINYFDENTLTWTSLLKKLLPEEYAKTIKDEKGNSILDLEGLTYPEIAQLADLLRAKNQSNKNTKSLKKQIVELVIENFENKAEYPNQEKLIDFAKKKNIPVLTTNYDHSLLHNLHISKIKYDGNSVEDLQWNNNKYKLTYTQPFNRYYKEGNKFNDSTNIENEFAVWFIHGTRRYSNSLCINNTDYVRNISTMSKILKDTKKDEKTETWIDIFLNNDLIVFGLGLDSDELDLRWLLLKRFYNQEFLGKHNETIYFHIENKLPKGKKKYFNALGIKCVKIEDFNDFYGKICTK